MRILTAHVENHEGWSMAEILVQEGEAKALVRMEHEWEDLDGSTVVLWSEGGFEEWADQASLCDRIYTADGYGKLVDSRFEAIE